MPATGACVGIREPVVKAGFAHESSPCSRPIRGNINLAIKLCLSAPVWRATCGPAPPPSGAWNLPMDANAMPEQIDDRRRRFLAAAAVTVAATQLGTIRPAHAQAGSGPATKLPAVKPGAHTTLRALKQIDAGVLTVGYAEDGPADGPAVILLHGWPYDIYSYVDVAPLLASAGYRAIVPFLRGYGTTQFLSNDTVRNGQPAALAVDLKDFLDALKIEKPILAGFDWGAR